MKFYTVDVMIPTYKPGQEFAELLPRLFGTDLPDPVDPGCKHREKVLEPGVGAVIG